MPISRKKIKKNRQIKKNKRFQIKDNTEKRMEKMGINEFKLSEDFICPITKEVMLEPVITSDGYSYESWAIEEWFRENTTSPMTNKYLKNRTLIPNYILKTLIENYENDIFGIAKKAFEAGTSYKNEIISNHISKD